MTIPDNACAVSLSQNNAAAEVYLHIGLPKTATTSLQEGVFNRLDKYVEYIGVMQPRSTNQSELYNDILAALYCAESEFLERSALVAKRIRNKICSRDIPILISEEMFTVDNNGLTWQQKLWRLGKIFADFRLTILVTVRDPVKAAYSLYVELYRQIYKEFPTFSSFFFHANQAQIYNYEQLHLELARSFSGVPVKYLAFERLIKQVNMMDMFGGDIDFEGQTLFKLPVSNTKNKSARGYYTNKVTLNEWLASNAGPIKNRMLLRISRPFLKLHIPFSKVCIPFINEHDEKRMKQAMTSSNIFFKSISGIEYL